MTKRLCVITLITILLISVMCPSIKTHSFVYADSTTDQWQSVTTNEELAQAFRYYCKSRNLTIEGSILDALTTFTTNTFNNICNTIGIDVTALQADIKKHTDGNNRLQFLFNQSGLSAYNRIFAEFLQNNNLAVGDTVNNEVIDEGFLFTDADGYSCKVFVALNNKTSGIASDTDVSRVYQQKGSSYIYSATDTYSFFDSRLSMSQTYNLTSALSVNLTGAFSSGSRYDNYYYSCSPNQYSSSAYVLSAQKSGSLRSNGYPTVIYYPYNEKLCFGTFHYPVNNSGTNYVLTPFIDITDGTKEDYTINLTTNNNTINQPVTINEGDSIIINNEGDTIINEGNEDPDPSVPSDPDNPTDPDNPSSTTDIDFPNFNFPSIPDIDFNLGDLSEKFPFSIPFDLVAFFTVLNADPVAPAIDRTIPLPSPIDDWHFQADFSQFDNYAAIIRNVEYIGFVIGLIYLTVRFVKG